MGEWECSCVGILRPLAATSNESLDAMHHPAHPEASEGQGVGPFGPFESREIQDMAWRDVIQQWILGVCE